MSEERQIDAGDIMLDQDDSDEFDDDEEDDEGEYTGPGEQEAMKPSKDEIKIAKWMKKNVKTKKTKFLSHNVEYFTANKAIDALMASEHAQGAAPLFNSREQCVEFLDIMLEHKFFHRAKKVPVTMEELKGSSSAGSSKSSKKDKKPNDSESSKEGGSSKRDKEEQRKDTEAEQSCAADNTNGSGTEKKEKRKRKIRLDMHPEQVFVDGSEAYVWIYNLTPIHYWIFGLILVLGAIGICLFPLWPPMLRKGVYYLSVAAAGFLVFILALTVVRLILFTLVWLLTGGKLHFWIFPNLTEDVGFLPSFWPLYESKYVNEDKGKSGDSKRSKSKSKKKDKDSDDEAQATAGTAGDEDTINAIETEKIEEIKEHDADMELRHRHANKTETEDSQSSGAEAAAGGESDTKGSRSPSESESDLSGKDYEIISSSEVQNVK